MVGCSYRAFGFLWKRVGKGTRSKGPIAHHDLPTAFEPRFIAAEIDPNHGDNGRWIPKRTHKSWHSVKRFERGGPFNQVWREFFLEKPQATAAEIQIFLDRIRSGEVFYPLDLDNANIQGFSFQ